MLKPYDICELPLVIEPIPPVYSMQGLVSGPIGREVFLWSMPPPLPDIR